MTPLAAVIGSTVWNRRLEHDIHTGRLHCLKITVATRRQRASANIQRRFHLIDVPRRVRVGPNERKARSLQPHNSTRNMHDL